MSESSLRADIVEVGRRMYARGYTAYNDVNITLRLDANRLHMTPKSVCKGFMTPDMMCITDLGVSYYYSNQPDKALAQFDTSLKLDPKHAKTLLNVGIVKAFGKQDLEGAEAAWKQVIAIAPDGPEGQAAKRALDSLTSAHAGVGKKPGV